MRLEEYLNNHTIIKIGISPQEYVSSEIIVDNPIELITTVRNNDCYISEIRWWDHVKIASGSSIGYGGPRDPSYPNQYYYAETDICKVFNIHSQDEEYFAYLEQIKRAYFNHNLFPAFDIKRR